MGKKKESEVTELVDKELDMPETLVGSELTLLELCPKLSEKVKTEILGALIEVSDNGKVEGTALMVVEAFSADAAGRTNTGGPDVTWPRTRPHSKGAARTRAEDGRSILTRGQ